MTLPDWYLKACVIDPDDVALCPCQWGRCGHCSQLGSHDDCNTRKNLHGKPPRQPIATLVGRRGTAVASVWPKWGRGCRWLCPCDCEITPAPKPVQLDLFGLAS